MKTTSRTRTQLTSLLLIGALGFLWGSSYSMVAYALESMPPITLTTIRVSLAAFALSVIALLQGHSFPSDSKTWCRFLVQGIVNPAIAWTLITWGQKHVGGALASVINSLSPIFTVLLIAVWTRHEPVTRQKVVGVMLGFAGILTIMGISAFTESHSKLLAEFAILLGTFGYAVSAIHGRHFARLTPIVTATGTLAGASIVLIPISLIIDRPWTLSPSLVSVGATTVLTIFCTALPFLLYFSLLRIVGAIASTSVSYVRVGVAMLLGSILHAEPITTSLLVGLFCIVGGVVLVTRSPQAR
jgi:drug/metabolite transporter (DMT)-like permease